ncbi:hypothetical protein [Paenibacillus lignilyticus]|uniref:DUF3955 domain-containing protein n=1 Tax=Paenibacillus lignilyticus TaxID=1172615 RepID=A0ABS5CL37_9BACL|nr:hypothetical protein [Paenibacillus lignilyticus]MBP3966579.1 hypothetical protein [Paenibacillus lignilyticus]
MKRYVFAIAAACIMICLAILAYWDVYRPRVGPVGNGPDDAAVLRVLILRLIYPAGLLVVGIIGLWRYKKKRS